MFCANLGAALSSAAVVAYWVNQGSTTLTGGYASVDGIVDASNNVYMYMNTSTADGVIQKFNSSGALQWQKVVSNGAPSRVAVSSAGDVYLLTNTGEFIKLNSAGVLQWDRTPSMSGSASSSLSFGLVLDGTSAPILFLDDNSGSGGLGWVVKMTAAGAVTWSRTAQISSSMMAVGNGVDSSNNIYSLGIDANAPAVLLMKHNSSGTLQWQKNITFAVTPSTYGLTVTAAGDCYAALDNTITKINTSGVVQWQRSMTNAFLTVGLSNAAIDAATGDVYAVGYSWESVFVRTPVVFKFDSAGTLQWKRKVTVAGSTNAYCNVGFVRSTSLHLFMFDYLGYGAVIKVPTDGTKTGTYGRYTYTASSDTVTNTTGAVTAGAATIATGSVTVSPGAATVSAASITNTLTTIP